LHELIFFGLYRSESYNIVTALTSNSRARANVCVCVCVCVCVKMTDNIILYLTKTPNLLCDKRMD